jgi:hypothetical protein
MIRADVHDRPRLEARRRWIEKPVLTPKTQSGGENNDTHFGWQLIVLSQDLGEAPDSR